MAAYFFDAWKDSCEVPKPVVRERPVEQVQVVSPDQPPEHFELDLRGALPGTRVENAVEDGTHAARGHDSGIGVGSIVMEGLSSVCGAEEVRPVQDGRLGAAV